MLSTISVSIVNQWYIWCTETVIYLTRIHFAFFFILALEAKTTIHKSAKGPISVAECDNNGKYISVENTSRSKSVSLSGWKLCQEIENGETFTFKFPENCVLKSNQTIKVIPWWEKTPSKQEIDIEFIDHSDLDTRQRVWSTTWGSRRFIGFIMAHKFQCHYNTIQCRWQGETYLPYFYCNFSSPNAGHIIDFKALIISN